MGYRTTIPLILLFCSLTGPVWASESGCTSEDSPAEKAQGEGLKAYVDPDTGELLSSPPKGEPLEAPAAAAQATAPAEIQQQVLPDGSVVADIGDRFVTELRVEIVNGKAVTCHRSAATTLQPDPMAASQTDKMPDDGR